jgi:hypothetical protein
MRIAFTRHFPFAIAGTLIALSLSAFVLTPSIHLMRYAGALRRAQHTNSSRALSEVLERQQRLWRFVGGCVLIWLAILLAAVADVYSGPPQ